MTRQRPTDRPRPDRRCRHRLKGRDGCRVAIPGKAQCHGAAQLAVLRLAQPLAIELREYRLRRRWITTRQLLKAGIQRRPLEVLARIGGNAGERRFRSTPDRYRTQWRRSEAHTSELQSLIRIPY